MPDQKTATSPPAGPPHQSTVDAVESDPAAQRAELVGVAEPSPDGEADPDSRVDEPGPDAEPDARDEPGPGPDPDGRVDEPDLDTERARDEASVTDEQAVADTEATDVADEAGVDPESTEEEPAADSTVDASADAAADASTADTTAELAPGDVPGPQPAALWAGEDTEAIRERWRELQARFVDDPHGATAAADDLIGEAVGSLTAALAEQRSQLGAWRAGGDFDTERLRVAVTGYRDFLDRVLSI